MRLQIFARKKNRSCLCNQLTNFMPVGNCSVMIPSCLLYVAFLIIFYSLYHRESQVLLISEAKSGWPVPIAKPVELSSLYMRSARVILPQLVLSNESNWLQICWMSFSDIFPISLSLYITNSDLLQPQSNQQHILSS